jgi:anaerobic selenocysteine-containing dehydrogenase
VEEVLTRCRICESACGLVAEVDQGTVVRLRPDAEHPASRGFACRKGSAFVGIQNHPQRLVQPQVRDGALRSASWEEALSRAGQALADLQARHGPESVGLYVGNAVAHSLGSVLGVTALHRALGTSKFYSSLSLDNSEMFVVLEEVMGNPMATFVADYAESDLLLLIGTDPVASQPSQVQSHPGGVAEIIGRAKAGALVVVDPRRSATARRASSHLRARPGSDAALLAHLVRRALADPRTRGRADADPLLRPEDLDALAAAVAPWTLDEAVAATGLTVEEVDQLAERLLSAERPLVWCGLGILLGPDGTVGYWLTLVLQAVLGGLDREGGWLQQRGAVDLPSLFARLGIPGRDPNLRSRIGGYPAVLGALAAATMADDILTDGPRQLRGLVVIAGNPAITLPDTPRAREALDTLDVLVCVDLFVNDTGARADVVLPAATWLERPELAVHSANQARRPHLQLSPAAVPPRGEAREDWQILLDLARATGGRPFGSLAADLALRWTGATPTTIARAANLLSPVGWKKLRGADRGVDVNKEPLGALRRRGSDHRDKTVHLAIPEFIDALREHTDLGEPPTGGLALQLVTSVRPVETMNSWMHTGPGARRAPVARMHPDDAAVLGDGGLIEVWRADAPDTSRVLVEFKPDEGVRPGVLVLPYGWGHADGAIGSGEDGPNGVNANMLVATDRLEPFTGQPLSNGQWVLVAAGVR